MGWPATLYRLPLGIEDILNKVHVLLDACLHDGCRLEVSGLVHHSRIHGRNRDLACRPAHRTRIEADAAVDGPLHGHMGAA